MATPPHNATHGRPRKNALATMPPIQVHPYSRAGTPSGAETSGSHDNTAIRIAEPSSQPR